MFVKSEVERILVEADKVIGVKLKHSDIKIKSESVISTIGIE